MPLQNSSWDSLKADIKAAPSETFVIFTGAKGEDGKSWCPPCNKAAPDFERVFGGDEHHALVVPFEIDDFDRDVWPRKEWAVRGVPMLYRLKDGEITETFCMHNDLPFGELLDAYVAGEEAYEKYNEEKRGEGYIPPEVRWRWLREDFDLSEKRAAEDLARGEERAKWKKEYAAKRKATQNGQENGANGEKKARTEPAPADAKVCNGVACAA